MRAFSRHAACCKSSPRTGIRPHTYMPIDSGLAYAMLSPTMAGRIMDIALTSNIISTLAVVAGLTFAGWQLRAAEVQRRNEAALQLLQSVRSLEFVEGAIRLRELPDNMSWTELKTHLGEHWPKAWLVCMTLDGLGALVHRGDIDSSITDDFFKHTTLTTWRKMKVAIGEMRSQWQLETMMEWFQWLVQEQERRNTFARMPVYRKPP